MHESARRRLLAPPLLIAVMACDLGTAYGYGYDVVIAEGVLYEPDATVVMIASPGSGDIADGDADATSRVGNTENSFSGSGTAPCDDTCSMSFFAFLDTDHDGRWDTDEAWGEDPDNPVELQDDGYVATIVIEHHD
jgi:hypothetical protein